MSSLTLVEIEAICSTSKALPVELLRSLFEQSEDCIKVISLEGRVEDMTAKGRKAMDVDDISQVRGRFWWDLWPVESRELVKTAVMAAVQGQNIRFEVLCFTLKGVPKWWEVGLHPVYGADGCIQYLVSVSRDISEHARDREQLKAIAHEMGHRVSNAYAIAIAMIKLCARGNEGAQPLADKLCERLSNVARAQRALIDTSKTQDLAEVVKAVTSMFDNQDDRIRIEPMPNVVPSLQAAQTIALVLGELCTNSMKYGALGHEGRIVLSARAEDLLVVFEWDEHSGATAAANTDHGGREGLNLMQRMLMLQSGWLKTGFGDRGMKAEFALAMN